MPYVILIHAYTHTYIVRYVCVRACMCVCVCVSMYEVCIACTFLILEAEHQEISILTCSVYLFSTVHPGSRVQVYRWTLNNSKEVIIWHINLILVIKNRKKKLPMDRR